MRELAEHMLRPIVAHPDHLQLQVIEGEASVVIEAIVHADDRTSLESDDGRTLRAIRTVLSAAAGRQKATFDLVDAFADEPGEE